MKAFAFNALVGSAAKIEAEARERMASVSSEGGNEVSTLRSIRTVKDAVDALQDAIQTKINTMLGSPGQLSFSAIKDTKAAMEMIDALQTKYAPQEKDKTGKSGLSDEAAEAIRKQILGLKN